MVFEDDRPAGGTDAGSHLVVFDGDWEAVEGAEVVAAHDGVFGGFGLFDGDVVGDEEEGVKLMVNVIDAFQEEFGELDG